MTELSAHDTSIFSFKDNSLSKSQRIFTKLDLCIDIVEIWIKIAIGYISSFFDRIFSPRHDGWVLSFQVFILLILFYFFLFFLCVCVCVSFLFFFFFFLAWCIFNCLAVKPKPHPSNLVKWYLILKPVCKRD